MIGGLMKRGGIIAVAAAASIYSTNAMAADLGGDCCADLEERVAELEATTARKGNRKVSLTISGQVNELVYWWDDGVESNIYQGTNNFSNSRFRMKGSANINEDWSAGYYIEIQVLGAVDSSQTATNDDAGNGISLRHSAWYLKSKRLGSFWVGQHSFATDNIVLFANGGTGTATAANYNVGPGAGLTFVGSGNVRLADVFGYIDSDRGNIIRYDSPSIAGFVMSAAWGEDDIWDVALTYAGEFNGIKISGGIGYLSYRDSTGDQGYDLNGPLYGTFDPDFEDIRGSVSVLHVPSGLFMDFAGVYREFDDPAYDDFSFWMIRGGLYRKWFPLGKTSIFGEYAEASNGANAGFTLDNGMISADGTIYGIGVNQYVDAAAMEIYFGWRHFELDAADANGAIPTEDIDTVYFGSRIQF